MSSIREQAKQSATHTDKAGEELKTSLSAAHEYELQLKKEDNRHREDMHKRDKGVIGRFIGEQSNAASFAAIITLMAGLVGVAFALYFSNSNHENSEFWGQQIERLIALITATLAFLFGKSGSK